MLFTTDTGASKTIISRRIFESMSAEDKPKLSGASKLIGACGTQIKEQGKGLFQVKLGPVSIEVEAIVADIDDDGLLGVDVLQNSTEGPSDILLSKGVLLLNKQEVPIMQIGLKTRVRQVTAADHFVIPAQCESVIDVFVERHEYDDFTTETEYLVEPTEHFQESYPLRMASTLVDINGGCTCKVRILNPFPTAMSIKQDAVIGQAAPIMGKPRVLAQKEDPTETDNFTSIRRVMLEEKINQVSDSNTAAPRKEEVGSSCTVPEHLTELYQRATQNLAPEEKQKVADLLIKYQDCFSKDEWDIGLTHLSEHEIKTGDSQPIKQPPRRVPLAYAEKEKAAIEELKAKGVIRDSVSPWASPIVLVSKKDGTVRPCVDYRKVNSLVEPDGFPLPRIQDCLDAVAGSSLFSTLDLTSGYFQIPLKEEDIPKSAFVCKYGHF